MNTKGNGNDNFQTPKFLFDKLNNVFSFTLDAACISTNCLCANGNFFDQGVDGLTTSWAGHRVFCNPPFSGKDKWIAKAVEEVENNNCPVVVMVLPSNSMDSKPFHKYVFGKYYYEILEGRISFVKDGKPTSGNNSGTVLIYFWKKPVTKEK